MIHEKVKKNLGIGMIMSSFIFLFNPDIAIVDILPDLFGYILLVCGLTQFAALNEAIADARRCFMRACALSGINLILILVLFGMVSPREMPITLLLFAFVMGVLNLIYIIPGYLHLFSGFLYLGQREESKFLLKRKQYKPLRKPKKYDTDARIRARYETNESRRKARYSVKPCVTERMRNITVMFAVFKSVGSVLPEFSALLKYEYFDSLVNYYDFINLYRTFSIIFVLIVGIFWLCKILRYFFLLRADRMFIDTLKAKYEAEILPNKEYFIKKYVKKYAILFTIAAFSCIDLYFDGYNLLPGFICATVFFVASYSVRHYSERWKWCAGASVLYFVSSVLFEISELRFNRDYFIEIIMRNPDAYAAHREMLVLSCVQNVALAAMIISSLVVTAELIRRYTGFYVAGHDSYNPEEKARELHSELIRPLYVTGFFGILAAVSKVAFVYCMSTRFGGMWIISLVFASIYASLFFSNLGTLTKQVDYKYMLS